MGLTTRYAVEALPSTLARARPQGNGLAPGAARAARTDAERVRPSRGPAASSPGQEYKTTNEAAMRVMQRVKRLMAALEGSGPGDSQEEIYVEDVQYDREENVVEEIVERRRARDVWERRDGHLVPSRMQAPADSYGIAPPNLQGHAIRSDRGEEAVVSPYDAQPSASRRQPPSWPASRAPPASTASAAYDYAGGGRMQRGGGGVAPSPLYQNQHNYFQDEPRRPPSTSFIKGRYTATSSPLNPYVARAPAAHPSPSPSKMPSPVLVRGGRSAAADPPSSGSFRGGPWAALVTSTKRAPDSKSPEHRGHPRHQQHRQAGNLQAQHPAGHDQRQEHRREPTSRRTADRKEPAARRLDYSTDITAELDSGPASRGGRMQNLKTPAGTSSAAEADGDAELAALLSKWSPPRQHAGAAPQAASTATASGPAASRAAGTRDISSSPISESSPSAASYDVLVDAELASVRHDQHLKRQQLLAKHDRRRQHQRQAASSEHRANGIQHHHQPLSHSSDQTIAHQQPKSTVRPDADIRSSRDFYGEQKGQSVSSYGPTPIPAYSQSQFGEREGIRSTESALREESSVTLGGGAPRQAWSTEPAGGARGRANGLPADGGGREGAQAVSVSSTASLDEQRPDLALPEAEAGKNASSASLCSSSTPFESRGVLAWHHSSSNNLQPIGSDGDSTVPAGQSLRSNAAADEAGGEANQPARQGKAQQQQQQQQPPGATDPSASPSSFPDDYDYGSGTSHASFIEISPGRLAFQQADVLSQDGATKSALNAELEGEEGAKLSWPAEPSPMRDDLMTPSLTKRNDAFSNEDDDPELSSTAPQHYLDKKFSAHPTSNAKGNGQLSSADVAGQKVWDALPQSVAKSPPSSPHRQVGPFGAVSPTSSALLSPGLNSLPSPGAQPLGLGVSPPRSPASLMLGLEAKVLQAVRDTSGTSPSLLPLDAPSAPHRGRTVSPGVRTERRFSPPPAAPTRSLQPDHINELLASNGDPTTPTSTPLDGKGSSAQPDEQPATQEEEVPSQDAVEADLLRQAMAVYTKARLPSNPDPTTISMVVASKLPAEQGTDMKQLLGDTVAQAVCLAKERVGRRNLLDNCTFGRQRVRSLASQMKAALRQTDPVTQVAEEAKKVCEEWCALKVTTGLRDEALAVAEVEHASSLWKLSSPEARRHVVDSWADVVVDSVLQDAIQYFNAHDEAGPPKSKSKRQRQAPAPSTASELEPEFPPRRPQRRMSF
ncbi:hypothetical protein DIPPA_13139 [Diplonema papillatum]|nr:hypothetical protein DIPPA_13139 [Diplonema papillatum]